jgi:hypothetical protein
VSKPQTHLSRDIFALRYLTALQAGDLDGVAALWEEAGGDVDLEEVLVEVESILIEEESASRTELRPRRDGSDQATAPELRTPASRKKRWQTAMSLSAALAAVCLVIYLTWLSVQARLSDARHPLTQQDAPRVLDGAEYDQGLQELRPRSAGAQSTTFSWPLEMKSPVTVVSRIPDLFD